MTVFGDPQLNALERTWSKDLDIRLTDTCLRDGSHHKRHQFTAEEVRSVIAALDDAGVPVLEVTHGDGLGGSSFNYGFSHTPEQELILTNKTEAQLTSSLFWPFAVGVVLAGMGGLSLVVGLIGALL